MAASKCVDCGAEFISKFAGGKAQRCAPCQRLRNLRKMRETAHAARKTYSGVCMDCGKQFESFSPKTKRCDPCRKFAIQQCKYDCRRKRSAESFVYISDGYVPIVGIPIADYEDYPRGNVIAWNREDLLTSMARGVYPPGLRWHRSGGSGKIHRMSGVYGVENRQIDD